MKYYHYAVTRWSAPWKDAVKVIKAYDGDILGGIGWVVVSYHDDQAEAFRIARELRASISTLAAN